jgi:hypothetical protein
VGLCKAGGVSDTRQSAACGPQADRDLTSIATLIEDPARSVMLAVGAIRHLDDRDHELTDRGQHLIERLDIDLAALRASRRVFARSCVDWSDRRIHLAGALPAAERFDDKIDEWLAT